MSEPNTQVTIERITLDIGGVKVFLTVEQAKQLQSTLDELFGDKPEKIVDRPVPFPVDRPCRPFRPLRPGRPWVWPLDQGIWCSASGATGTFDAAGRNLTVNLPSTPDGGSPLADVAAELGRRGGRKGGPARAAKMTATERSESARNASRARWRDKVTA